MSYVVYLKALADPSTVPCLVLIDMQREYLAELRLIAIPDAREALENCRRALEHARSKGLPIAFLRQISRSAFFNASTSLSGWIEGFEPNGADMVFERNQPSTYSNKQFAELMNDCGGNFVFGGFAGETACLSTAIDAFHRRHRFTYLFDASASLQHWRSVGSRGPQCDQSNHRNLRTGVEHAVMDRRASTTRRGGRRA